jgi:heme A synthase
MHDNRSPGGSRSAGMIPMILTWIIFLFYLTQFGIGEMLRSSMFLWYVHRWLGVIICIMFIVLWIITKSVPFIKRTRIILPVTAGLLLSQVLLGFKISFSEGNLITVHFTIAIVLFCVLAILLWDMRFGAKM